ncbi:hypothetical protein PDK03_06545 [Bacillus cereus group sp. TH204-1LC]|uniref:hypothetical protein n=1 Tax=Bacillus cereus group TaxID=86661 RepID=UPI000A2075B0|nr:hypothetical protein [Bacillus cereus group sp. TH204-1LC]ARO21363.1 hypothetical protein B2J90_28505 [Bacillus cereus]MCU5076956.1 hypothetical protein [Bacillus cereus]MDA1616252.1 hypothetical protein [Bacillus cereus group sp. TH204-1LC]MDA1977169.1 hypothetical protein [Bacillus cereus]
MTPNEIGIVEKILTSITEGDKPFMVLFAIIMLFVIFMSVKVMGYVRSVSDSHKEQITAMNDNMKEQREDHYKMIAEDRLRSDNRERELFVNLEKNTQQLEGIATTLKEVQFNFTSLENKVTQNFDYLEKEIESVKEKVSKKEDHE